MVGEKEGVAGEQQCRWATLLKTVGEGGGDVKHCRIFSTGGQHYTRQLGERDVGYNSTESERRIKIIKSLRIITRRRQPGWRYPPLS